ncbi:MAG TPA: DNA-binding protein, partial [Pseudolabrys sp.]|nr:DNA-binding protein [Pseudolabrys sp.]
MSDQQAVIDYLAAPSTHGGAKVTRIDTHAASVFLAGERALKIKRAVRFPFLDFTTLDKRKAACEAELAVNRPYAPAIYRRVVAITREADGRLALGGTGEPVEWAVEMARFDENATLDRLATRGAIDDALADKLGRAAAVAHAAAAPASGSRFAGTLAEIVTQNDNELRETPALFPPDEVAALTQKTRAMLDRVRPLL